MRKSWIFVLALILSLLYGAYFRTATRPSLTPQTPFYTQSPPTIAATPQHDTTTTATPSLIFTPRPTLSPVPTMVISPTPVPWKTGGLEVRVTNASLPEASKVVITVRELQVRRSTDSEKDIDDKAGWVTVVEDARTFDLAALMGIEQVLGSNTLQAGSYEQIRMALTSVVITLEGKELQANIPEEKVYIMQKFHVEEGKTTVLTLGFDADKSVVLTRKIEAKFEPLVNLWSHPKADIISSAPPTSDLGPTPIPTSTPVVIPTPAQTPPPTPISMPTLTPVPTASPIPTVIAVKTPEPTPAPTSAPTPSPVPVTGQGTSGISLSLTPSLEGIGVISSFSGDSNGNNRAILEFRSVGTTQWVPGITMTADRRPTLTIFEQGIVNNIYKNQWRAIVFWLKPDTLYEVKVIYTDLDGVSGSNIVTATTRTRTDNPPSIGRVYYVSVSGSDNNDGLTTGTAFGTIQKTANIVNPGDRVLIMPGVYNEGIRITRSGTADNYITFQSYDLNNKAVLDTPASWPSSRENEKNNIFLGGADYIRIKGLDLRNAADSNIGTNHDGFGRAFSDNVIIEDNILSNAGTDWRDSGVSIIGESSNFIIQRNQILRNNTYSGEPMGVWFSGLPGGHIFRENRVIGCFKDGVGGGPNFSVDGGPGANTFIYNNYIEGAWDDGIEAEGGGINMAIWGNIIKGRVCSGGQVMNMGLGIAPVTVGPAYIFRNTVFDFADAAMKLGSSSYGFIYLYHNTLYTTQAGAQGPSTFGSDANIGNIVSRNNVYYPYRRALNIYGPVDGLSLSFDYDNLSNGGRYSSLLRWGTVTYNSLSAFQSATGLERHGLSEDSQFVDASKGDLRLQPRSPNIDKGLVLPGFNDANSPWPYSGNAPDLGALEYSAR